MKSCSPATGTTTASATPFQASYIDAIIKDLQAGKAPAEKTIIMDEKGFDASTITQEDVDNYGI